jgi:YggT family protein
MGLLFTLIDAYSLVVLVSVIFSWIPDARETPAARWLEKATEPVLKPIRQLVPSVGGFDISPMLLLVGLHFLKRLIASFF